MSCVCWWAPSNWTELNSVKYYRPTQGKYFGLDSDIFTCVFVASNAPAVSDKLIFQFYIPLNNRQRSRTTRTWYCKHIFYNFPYYISIFHPDIVQLNNDPPEVLSVSSITSRLILVHVELWLWAVWYSGHISNIYSNKIY